MSSGPTGSRRKYHSKSRTGCQICRSRKIKCDEQRPSCLNCVKRELQCSFLQTQNSTWIVLQSETLNLELLHHFTVSTFATLSPDTQIRELWRVTIPQMGFTTDHILDGVLALAALHIARYNTGRRHALLAYAIERHSASLSKALPLIFLVKPQNCTPLFVFGVLTLYYSLARPIQEDDALIFGSGVIPEWLYLMRGIDTVVMAEASVFSSPVSLIFRSTWGSLDYWKTHTPEQYPVLTELKDTICAETPDDRERQLTLQETVVALTRSYTFFYGGNFKDQDKLRGFYEWLFKISDAYLRLLKTGDDGSLGVLAFYAVLVKDLEKYWWIEGGDSAELHQATNIVRAVQASGTIKTLVYTSVCAVDQRASFPEARLRSRTSVNGYFPELERSLPLRTAMGSEKRTMLIDPNDIGRFAAAVFINPERFSGLAVDIGCEALTVTQDASVITEVSGSEIWLSMFLAIWRSAGHL
ncbi:hypothetical protein N7508_003519 [Penicillium antarcticum]|uniref:uncharacterized protein n=1 Tax=Penicillium antarcticum TaxID=416450 RepID=UPI0023895671|nr:uncharacterized protein N7508_003519 [Penicillium antarcticum]KAJ5312689.1 hypothetical protein N7508_003519 [Penicillium antarcticum]